MKRTLLALSSAMALGLAVNGQSGAVRFAPLPTDNTLKTSVRTADRYAIPAKVEVNYNPIQFFGGPPANDNCSGAITLPVGTSCSPVTGDVAGATQSIAAITCATFTGNADDDVWYKFVATATTAIINVTGSAGLDPIVDLRSGACNGVNIACADATVAGEVEVINATALTVGNTYFIRVYDYAAGVPTTTTFDICVYNVPAAPANDNCANAALLTVNNSCVPTAGTTAGATQSLAAITCNTFLGTAEDDVWYRFVATASTTTIQVDGDGTFDAVVDLRSGACNGANIACADGTAAGGTEVINATGLTVGATYRFRVYDYEGTADPTPTFTVCVYNTPTAPPNDLCTGAIVQNLSVPGTVTVNGNNVGATDSEGIGTATVWEAFTISTCANVTADFCGSVDFTNFFVSLTDACPFVAVIDSSSTGTCGDGTLSITWDNLPAGTYYYPVLSAIGTAWGAYTVEFTATSCGGGGPVNDECTGATVQNLNVPGSVTVNGNNIGATDSEGVGTATVWEAFTIGQCATVTADFCGSVDFTQFFISLTDGCPFVNVIDSTSTGGCGDGTLSITWANLPAGTYYYPVLSDPLTAWGPYTVEFSAVACGGGGPVNDECAGATVQNLSVPGSVTVNGNNIGATDSEGIGTATVWEAFTIGQCATVTADFCGSVDFTQFFISLTDGCPFVNVIDSTSTGGCGDGTLSITWANLPAGTYYYPVLSDPLTAWGPYTVEFSAVPCGTVPANDQCANIVALNLAVPGTINFSGDNTGATTTNDYVPGSTWENPPPVPASVWHAFTTTGCADITVEHCGTNPAFANVWIILATSCPADDDIVAATSWNNTDCGDGNWTVYYENVPAGTYYLAVLTEAGSEGPYTIDVSTTACAGSGTCDGGFVLSGNNNSTEDVCDDGFADVITFITSSTSTENFSYILTDANNNVISLLGSNSFDFETAAQGTYHVWGLSYNGILTNVIPGAPITGVGSNGTCFDLSTNFVTVNVELCSSVGGANSSAWSVFPNPGNGDFTVRNGGASGLVSLELFDLGGRSVHTSTVLLNAGQAHTMELAGRVAQGSYTLRITSGNERHDVRVVVN